MLHEITAAIVELAMGPFLRLRQAIIYRALELRAEGTLVSDLIGAAARLLLILAPFAMPPAPVAWAALAVVTWAALVALVEVLVVLCTWRRV